MFCLHVTSLTNVSFRIMRTFSKLLLLKNSLHPIRKRPYGIFNKKQSECAKDSCLVDKIALITGAADGIGLAIARSLLGCGIKGITLADCNNDVGVETLKQLCCEFGEERLLFIEADASQSKQYDWMFKKTIQNFKKVDIVINSAGTMNDINWENQILTNMHSPIIGTLLAMQYMSKSCSGKGGTVINIASILGMIPSAGYPIHTATQFGIVGFTRAIGSVCHFERTGVRTVVLCPGLTNTKLLRQAPYYAINERFRKQFKEESSGCSYQRAESVGDAVLEILEKACSGSVWVVENNTNSYEIQFPPVVDMKFKTQ